VWTRFPPEPNGYLHIGHAKAMHVDFGFAKEYGGVCYLRYDDTNPEAEKQEYIDHIQEIVSWMGWQPWKITYSSDYFQVMNLSQAVLTSEVVVALEGEWGWVGALLCGRDCRGECEEGSPGSRQSSLSELLSQ